MPPNASVPSSSQTYVALLRGINVGGKNKVEMSRLRAMFEALGHDDVSTYINSGNVIFRTAADTKTLRPDIEAAISREFGLDLMVLARDLSTMDSVENVLPGTWVHDKTAKTNVMFLDDPIDDASLVDELGPKPGIDHVRYAPGAIVWNTAAADWSKSASMKLAGRSIYRQMTVRNVNTFRKLIALMRAAAG